MKTGGSLPLGLPDPGWGQESLSQKHRFSTVQKRCNGSMEYGDPLGTSSFLQSQQRPAGGLMLSFPTEELQPEEDEMKEEVEEE